MTTRTIRPILTPPAPAGRLSAAVSVTGVLIRYSFYLIGALAFGVIGLGVIYAGSLGGYRIKQVDEAPAFRIAAAEVERRKPVNHVETGRAIGRVEVRQYGQLYDRDVDFTIVLAMPAQPQVARDFIQEISALAPLRAGRAVFAQRYHDLETRFGSVRAADFHIDADGRRKLCLAYLSRFDTAAVLIKGWYCEASGEKPSPVRLACLLDRLTLDAPLASKDADAFLRERMGRASYCSASPVDQTSDSTTRPLSSPSRWSQPAAQRRY
jgi:hypothetical protein